MLRNQGSMADRSRKVGSFRQALMYASWRASSAVVGSFSIVMASAKPRLINGPIASSKAGRPRTAPTYQLDAEMDGNCHIPDLAAMAMAGSRGQGWQLPWLRSPRNSA